MIIKEADEFVTLIKKINRELSQVEIPSDINFLGCSSGYVEEKLSSLKHTVDFYIRAIKSISKEQREK